MLTQFSARSDIRAPKTIGHPRANHFRLLDRVPVLAHPTALLSSLELLLDVLRGPLPAHSAGSRICQRGQDTQVVLSTWMAHSGPNYGRLRLQSFVRRILH